MLKNGAGLATIASSSTAENFMRGIDISHHQNDKGKVDLKTARAAGYEFCIVKCTQGTTYKDQFYEKNKKMTREAGMLFGVYHFAGNFNPKDQKNYPQDPIKEAEQFLKHVGDLLPGEIVVLDFETHVLKDPVGWCSTWLKHVESKLGFRPMLYTYHEFLKKYDWTKVSSANYGLWAARYGLQQQNPNNLFRPATGSWDFFAIWQYCSKGSVPGLIGNIDLNTCDMDMKTLRKYGKPEVECNHECPKHCS